MSVSRHLYISMRRELIPVPCAAYFLFNYHAAEVLLTALYNDSFTGKLLFRVYSLNILHDLTVYGNTALLYVSSRLRT